MKHKVNTRLIGMAVLLAMVALSIVATWLVFTTARYFGMQDDDTAGALSALVLMGLLAVACFGKDD